jgi:non-ribosomal peptide synthetase component E (peptide arylation enzyme)
MGEWGVRPVPADLARRCRDEGWWTDETVGRILSERLGEHGCAFIRPAPGRSAPSLDEIRAHLEGAGLARPKWPEEVREVQDFPRTPSGKVKKFALRAELRGHGPG